jgi:acetyl-CoA C-acetyltransferase
MKPIARVVAFGSHAQDPLWFTTSPIAAAVNAEAGAVATAIDLWEVNEAFEWWPRSWRDARSTRKAQRSRRCDRAGTFYWLQRRRIRHAARRLRERGAKRGVASICIGGGEIAACVELM